VVDSLLVHCSFAGGLDARPCKGVAVAAQVGFTYLIARTSAAATGPLSKSMEAERRTANQQSLEEGVPY
ncbi:MAG TPA: hypothetical protein VK638_33785, partial [Edaphobacter sp.]|nr:hypothetical protein [Edaphobacter sp.]